MELSEVDSKFILFIFLCVVFRYYTVFMFDASYFTGCLRDLTDVSYFTEIQKSTKLPPPFKKFKYGMLVTLCFILIGLPNFFCLTLLDTMKISHRPHRSKVSFSDNYFI